MDAKVSARIACMLLYVSSLHRARVGPTSTTSHLLGLTRSATSPTSRKMQSESAKLLAK